MDTNEKQVLTNCQRLIDPSVIIRDLTAMKSMYDAIAIDGIIKALKEAPTVDAVEVVRCKDCKHCTATSDGMVCECALPTKRMQDYYIYGSSILARVEADAFCSHGERRNDGKSTSA